MVRLKSVLHWIRKYCYILHFICNINTGCCVVAYIFYILLKKGASANAGPHYQKLYGRVTNTCSNRRGQPKRSAMQGPHSGRNPSLIRLTSPSGKYELKAFSTRTLTSLASQNLWCNFCCNAGTEEGMK